MRIANPIYDALAEKEQALAQAKAQKIITAKNIINLGLSITNVSIWAKLA